jgi:hypothetical protein
MTSTRTHAAGQVNRAATKQELTNLPAPQELRWQLDPTEHALQLSTWRTELPDPLCRELGRRLLIQHLEMSEWVLRRVEKVAFERDRGVRRSVDIDLNVPAGAPLFVDDASVRHWLVPLSVMWRRTLVHLELSDERGRSITTPGIRLAQQLEESILLAAAATVDPAGASSAEMRDFIRAFVAGERHQVVRCVQQLEEGATPLLQALGRNELFLWAFRRLQHGYSLYVFLPVDGGRHRLLRMSFEEPTNWRYREPRLERPVPGDPDPECLYAMDTPVHEWQHLAARLGWRPTRVRFQVPSAETATSYHFEVTAPDGVRIEKATLVAGRPNDPERHVSADLVEERAQTVGLHAVEVPNGSCSRVQLDLGIPTRGWLTTMLAVSWVILTVLCVVGLPWTLRTETWSDGEVRDLVLVLVTTSAGVAALISQREFSGLAARLVAPIRVLGAVAVTLPIVHAAILVLGSPPTERSPGWGWDEYAVPAVLLIVLLIVGLVTAAWVRSARAGKQAQVTSPWDMTVDDPAPHIPKSFWDAVDRFEFDSPAIRVWSAEAWHERYRWRDAKQCAALKALKPRTDRGDLTAAAPLCVHPGAACPLSPACPMPTGMAGPPPSGEGTERVRVAGAPAPRAIASRPRWLGQVCRGGR